MSEPTAEAKKFDDDTPESVVVRYGWGIDLMEEQGGTIEFESAYAGAVLQLAKLYDSIEHPEGLTFEKIRPYILPAIDDVRYLDEWQWCDRMRLAPLLLLRKGAPEMDALTPDYIRAVIFATLSDKPRHGAECMSYGESDSGYECFRSDMCPARIVNDVFVEKTGDMLARRSIFYGSEDPAMEDKSRLVVSTMRACLESYSLSTRKIFDSQVESIWLNDAPILQDSIAA